MGCSACCCCSPRIGAIVVGVFNILAGIGGLICVSYLVHIDELERKQAEAEMAAAAADGEDDFGLGDFGNLELNSFTTIETDLRGTVYSLFYSTILTTIAGIVILAGAIKEHRKFVKIGLALEILLTLGSIAVFVICMISGITWYFLMLHALVLIVQAWPTWAIYDYHKLLGEDAEVSNDLPMKIGKSNMYSLK